MGVRMRDGVGVPKDNPRSASFSGKRTMKNCRGNLDDFVLIDVDSDEFDSVLVIDVPESLQRKLRGCGVFREGKQFPFHGVISIDDDDDSADDQSDHAERPEVNMEGDPEVNIDGTSSKSSPASDHMDNCPDAVNGDDGDECRVVQEKRPAFNLSRCKKSFTEESSSRNCYGLYSELDSDSGSDSSDCEIMEGSCGELREQWERASRTRKSCRGQSGLRDQASPCSSRSHSDADLGVGSRGKQNTEAPDDTTLESENYKEFSSSTFAPDVGGGFVGGFSFNLNMENLFPKCDSEYGQESCWWSKPRSQKNTDFYEKDDIQFTTKASMEDHTFCSGECQHLCNRSFVFADKGKYHQGPSTCFNQDGAGKHRDHLKTCVREDNKQYTGEGLAFSNAKSTCNLSNDDDESRWNEDSVLSNRQCAGVTRNSTSDASDVQSRQQDIKKNKESPSERNKLVTSSLSQVKEPLTDLTNAQLINDMDPSCAPPGGAMPAVSRDIINEREKLKETDEYKRASEQEWAARQLQLQIQAEETQRLRKRKKAESLRILDMEKRQKQRLEEMRQTQKKDEEHLNMKDRLRVEVRKQLHILETGCFDMASLLRGLGVPVGGPTSHEVHAAYKRALLKFHPDRVSRSDIRQQVEAEEKFKLICRMKETYLST